VADVFILLKQKLGDQAYANGVKDSEHLLVEMFHRSTHEDSKKRILRNFKNPLGNLRCLVATVALGMGIQIEDVDIVMHLGSPKSILSYWQEAGRCARDGRPGYSYVLYDNFTLSQKSTSADVKKLIDTKECTRKQILKYLQAGQQEHEFEISENSYCDGCDEERCLCNSCLCCFLCSQKCPCSKKEFDVAKFSNLTDGPTDPNFL